MLQSVLIVVLVSQNLTKKIVNIVVQEFLEKVDLILEKKNSSVKITELFFYV